MKAIALYRQAKHTIARAVPVASPAYVRHAMSFSPPYQYISAADLAREWKAQRAQAGAGADDAAPKRAWAIVDVRDDDFEGGHIIGCWNVPSTQFPDRVQDVVERLRSAQNVVFHCSLSQARGPKAARIYREARDSAIKSGTLQDANPNQAVLVLREGFSNFGAIYKNDPELVKDYDEESWKYR